MTTEEKIRESLIDQLKAQNKVTEYCIDLIDTYMTHWRMKEQMTKDIEENGLRICVTSGNGYEKEIPNPSIDDIQRETSIMLQILDKLDLKTPILAGSKDDYL